ncbi:MAG: hypothetical protein GF411_14840 [Candidatus Lokiarchaeota archaeon]|nr:hypothetical protein [Candidatus Lokiarchaeota archaeon]
METKRSRLTCPYCRIDFCHRTKQKMNISEFEQVDIYKDKYWLADEIPVFARNRIEKIEYVGMATKDDSHRWTIINSAGPDNDVWFIFKCRIGHMNYISSELCLATKVNDKFVSYAWITTKTLVLSTNRLIKFEFSMLEKAYISSAIQSVLSGTYDCLELNGGE